MTTEKISYKFGGTSNATAEMINRCVEIGGNGIGITVSAPGALAAEHLDLFSDYSHIPEEYLVDKVTDLSLKAHAQYNNPKTPGRYDPLLREAVIARYAVNVRDLGIRTLQKDWVQQIGRRFDSAVSKKSHHEISMLGEQLQAEVYQSMGFYLLDPSRACYNLGTDVNMWRLWLADFNPDLGRTVMGGNITTDGINPLTIGRGGSDASHQIASAARDVEESHIMSDFALLSFDPGVVGDKARPVPDITYWEGGDLHETGTGTLHPAGIPPMIGTGIPTIARATNDPNGPRTVYTDELLDPSRTGKVIAHR